MQLKLDPTDEFDAVVQKLHQWSQQKFLQRLVEPVNRIYAFDFSPTIVRAVGYVPTANTIALPGAVFQPPFFHHSFPKWFNYGAIGSTVGHEITHGFGELGKFFFFFY